MAQDALQDALDDAFGAVGEGQGRGAGEVGGAVVVGDVGELGEQQVEVGLVVAVPAGPAGGEDAGGAAEDVDAEAGVVGDRRQAGGLGQGVRLEERVLGEGDAGLLDVGDVRVGIRADEFDVEVGRIEDGAELGDLAVVAGGEDEAAGGGAVAGL